MEDFELDTGQSKEEENNDNRETSGAPPAWAPSRKRGLKINLPRKRSSFFHGSHKDHHPFFIYLLKMKSI